MCLIIATTNHKRMSYAQFAQVFNSNPHGFGFVYKPNSAINADARGDDSENGSDEPSSVADGDQRGNGGEQPSTSEQSVSVGDGGSSDTGESVGGDLPLVVYKNIGGVLAAWDAYKTVPEHVSAIFHWRYTTHGATNQENCHPFKIFDDLYMAHNGMIRTIEMEADKSDTWHFVEYILRPSLEKDRSLLNNDKYRRGIERSIPGSKLAFMDGEGNIFIYNSHLGVMREDTWYSNSYSCTRILDADKPARRTLSDRLQGYFGRDEEDDDYDYYGSMGHYEGYGSGVSYTRPPLQLEAPKETPLAPRATSEAQQIADVINQQEAMAQNSDVVKQVVKDVLKKANESKIKVVDKSTTVNRTPSAKPSQSTADYLKEVAKVRVAVKDADMYGVADMLLTSNDTALKYIIRNFPDKVANAIEVFRKDYSTNNLVA